MEGYPQMTPVEADPTSLVYLARTPRVWRGGKGFQPRWRSSTARSMTPLSMSSTILSPSRTNAIGPPSVALGATWPTEGPVVPPENRPSVISKISRPRPAP